MVKSAYKYTRNYWIVLRSVCLFSKSYVYISLVLIYRLLSDYCVFACVELLLWPELAKCLPILYFQIIPEIHVSIVSMLYKCAYYADVSEGWLLAEIYNFNCKVSFLYVINWITFSWNLVQQSPSDMPCECLLVELLNF